MALNVKLESDAESARVKVLSLVSPRHRHIYSMKHLPAPMRIILDLSVMTADRKLYFVRNSKVGGTSVARMIHLHALGPDFRGSTDIAYPEITWGFRQWRPCLDALQSGEPVIFCQVRHPVDRLMSGFRNFFVARNHPWHWRHMPHMLRLGYSPQKPADYNLDVFLDYVELSFAASQLYTDRHWRKQIHNVAFGEVDYDVIGRTEQLAAGMRDVLERAEIADNGLTDMLSNRYNNTDAVSGKLDPTPAQRRRIENIYADDFEAFGYS